MRTVILLFVTTTAFSFPQPPNTGFQSPWMNQFQSQQPFSPWKNDFLNRAQPQFPQLPGFHQPMGLNDQMGRLGGQWNNNQHNYEMEKLRRMLAGPKDCHEVDNFDDETLYPDGSNKVTAYVNGEKLVPVHKHITYECNDPNLPSPFYKLETVTTVGQNNSGSNFGKSSSSVFIDKDKNPIQWEPNMNDFNDMENNINEMDRNNDEIPQIVNLSEDLPTTDQVPEEMATRTVQNNKVLMGTKTVPVSSVPNPAYPIPVNSNSNPVKPIPVNSSTNPANPIPLNSNPNPTGSIPNTANLVPVNSNPVNPAVYYNNQNEQQNRPTILIMNNYQKPIRKNGFNFDAWQTNIRKNIKDFQHKMENSLNQLKQNRERMMEQINYNNLKMRRTLEGPKDCQEVSNFNNLELYPQASVSISTNGIQSSNNKTKYKTFKCNDSRYQSPFYKLETISSGQNQNGVNIGESISTKYIDSDQEDFFWEADMSDVKLPSGMTNVTYKQ